MIDTPRVIESEALPAAVIRLTIPRSEIQKAMGPAIGEVIAAVTSQGVGPAGPVFSYHFRMDADTFDFEVGVPVSKPVTATGRVKPGVLPAARVLRTTYRGGYEGLGAGWGEFLAWIAASGHKPRADFWERYLAGPESGPDSSKWQTELNRPLAD
jgi:effector-binding domain-containing protein